MGINKAAMGKTLPEPQFCRIWKRGGSLTRVLGSAACCGRGTHQGKLASLSLQPHKTPRLLLGQDLGSRDPKSSSVQPVLSGICQNQAPISQTAWCSLSLSLQVFIPRLSHAWQTTKVEMGVATRDRLNNVLGVPKTHYCENDKMPRSLLNILLWFQLQNLPCK